MIYKATQVISATVKKHVKLFTTWSNPPTSQILEGTSLSSHNIATIHMYIYSYIFMYIY